MTSGKPRKHHSVPQSLLARFCIPGRGYLQAFDKAELKTFTPAIHDAGSERDFYTVRVGTRVVNFETAFQAVDDSIATVFGKLADEPVAQELTSRESMQLPGLVAIQFVRTKLQRTTPIELARQLEQRTRDDLGVELDETHLEIGSAEIGLLRLLDLDLVEQAFREKDFLLIEAKGDARFWISDNPVVMYNAFPYGLTGLGALGIEIYLPISPRRSLAFFCPSIATQIAESLNPAHPRPMLPQRDEYESMLKAMRSRSTYFVSDNYVQYINELQIRQSSRFLYSSDGDFGLAKRAITSAPDLATIRSLFTVGKFGEGFPRNDKMPDGEWLILEAGTNHHALPISIQSRPGQRLAFKVRDSVKFTLAMRDAPFDVATFYVDGTVTEIAREVIFDAYDADSERLLRLKHLNEGIENMMRGYDGD